MVQYPRMKNDEYQVFLMSCYCGFPISFARHVWFVVNKNGVLSRWEVLIVPDMCSTSWRHLHLNFRKPFEPLGLFSMNGKALFPSDQLGMIEGGEGSLAQKMVEFIESSPTAYPFCLSYSLLGPNSNSYVGWVLNHFPEFPGKLPWNAFGKGYKVKV